MRRAPSILATLGLAIASGAGALVLTDRAVGRLADPRFTPLTGPRATATLLVRPEFRVTVRTNEAGFRGAPLPRAKPPGVYRIVALGDSFTFGFGVRERQAWPARLAARLNAQRPARSAGAPRVEVVNLGVPGTGPLDYLWHLAHTGLALEPDLVVVGLFANDVNDLYQLRRFGARSPLLALGGLEDGRLAPRPWWKRAADATLPNLYALAGRAARFPAGPREARAAPPSARAARPPDPERLLAALGERYGCRDAVLARYRALPAIERATLDRVLSGEPAGDDVRPMLLLSALVDPDAEADSILLRSVGRRRAWRETADVLAQIVRLARRHGAETVLVVIPASEQVDRARWSVLEAAGFRLDPTMLADTALPDAARALAARESAGLVDLVADFRAHPDVGLYFRLDEHWNARGQAFAAARLAEALAPYVRPKSPA